MVVDSVLPLVGACPFSVFGEWFSGGIHSLHLKSGLLFHGGWCTSSCMLLVCLVGGLPLSDGFLLLVFGGWVAYSLCWFVL